MSAKEEAQVEARVLQLLERYLTVEEILGLPVEWDEPREALYPIMQNVGEAGWMTESGSAWFRGAPSSTSGWANP
jgi:hypothetical protein